MYDFEKKYLGDIVVIIVNISRATLKEAKSFKSLIDDELKKNKRKIIIDLSACEFIDSTFIGVLVVTLKKVSEAGGELRLVQPKSIAHSTLEATGTLNIFNVSETSGDALADFKELTEEISSIN